MRWGVLRYGPLLSAGTASASLPWQRVCRRCSQRTVLVDLPYSTAGSSDTCCDWALRIPPDPASPEEKEGAGRIGLAARELVCVPEEAAGLRGRQPYTPPLRKSMLAKEIHADAVEKNAA